MGFCDEITLVEHGNGTDKDGYAQTVERTTQVFADVLSVKRSEFYTGRQVGLKLVIAFRVRVCDYGGQEIVVHLGKRYRVERTYTKDGELLELSCSEEATE